MKISVLTLPHPASSYFSGSVEEKRSVVYLLELSMFSRCCLRWHRVTVVLLICHISRTASFSRIREGEPLHGIDWTKLDKLAGSK